MTAYVFDNRRCELGEGPLWHPTLQQLFWFDILNKQLMTRTGDTPRRWQFDDLVSAAGWIDEDRLLIASEKALFQLDLSNSRETHVADLEADQPETRSNDGRADRQGGFWIGTMGKAAEPGLGRIYRYYKGEVRTIVKDITIPNAICFSPDGGRAYYSCSRAKTIWRLDLDADGWPKGEAKVLLDMTGEDGVPDGAVVDANGTVWNAQWGLSRIAGYTPFGKFVASYDIPAKHSSCPAFGGPNLVDAVLHLGAGAS